MGYRTSTGQAHAYFMLRGAVHVAELAQSGLGRMFHSQRDTSSTLLCTQPCVTQVEQAVQLIEAGMLSRQHIIKHQAGMFKPVHCLLFGMQADSAVRCLYGSHLWNILMYSNAATFMLTCVYIRAVCAVACRLCDGGPAPPPGWPSTGAITYSNVTASYRPGLPPVLVDLSFHIEPGTSCGVVGRTGSGKSSLMLTLFRLIDVNAGSIFLDGVDTASIGLDALRKQLAIIPQVRT